MDLAQDIGFTEVEVCSLRKKFDVDFERMKEWYNGFNLDGIAMYNPLPVVQAIPAKRFQQYWAVPVSPVSAAPHTPRSLTRATASASRRSRRRSHRAPYTESQGSR